MRISFPETHREKRERERREGERRCSRWTWKPLRFAISDLPFVIHKRDWRSCITKGKNNCHTTVVVLIPPWSVTTCTTLFSVRYLAEANAPSWNPNARSWSPTTSRKNSTSYLLCVWWRVVCVVGECCYLCAAAAWFVRSGQPLGVGTIWFEGVICKMALAVDTFSSGDLRWLFQMKDTGIW